MEKFSSAAIVCDFSETQALFQAQWQQLFAQYHPYCLPIGNQPLILWALEALATLSKKPCPGLSFFTFRLGSTRQKRPRNVSANSPALR